MEEYGNTVINLHANQTQIISKFTSKTNQKEPLRGGHGGAPPSASSSCQFGSGEYTRERLVRLGPWVYNGPWANPPKVDYETKL